MSADQFLTLDGRPSVRVERCYPHPIDKVWRAVTTPEHLGQWFPSTVDIELRAGGSMRFGPLGPGVSQTGTVEVLEPPRLLVFTWGTDRLSLELSPQDGGTTLALTHSFDDRSGAPSFATGWGLCLDALRALLAGDAPPSPERGVARHEELVHEFGLDQADVTERASGWSVRIERQLTCPGPVAWNLWFGTDPRTGGPREEPAPGEPLAPDMAPGVVVGVMTELDPHRSVACEVALRGGAGGHVRLELADGTGHGAKVILAVTGADAAARDAALRWAPAAVERLAGSAAAWAIAQPAAV